MVFFTREHSGWTGARESLAELDVSPTASCQRVSGLRVVKRRAVDHLRNDGDPAGSLRRCNYSARGHASRVAVALLSSHVPVRLAFRIVVDRLHAVPRMARDIVGYRS